MIVLSRPRPASAPHARAFRPATGGSERPQTIRRRIVQSGGALVEDLQAAGSAERPRTGGFSPDFQVCLPYRGFFVWHVGGDDVVADANQILFVSGGEPFQLSGSLHGGYAELILTPALEVIAELLKTTESRVKSHPLFRRRSCRMTLPLQMLRAHLLHASRTAACDPMAAEELVLGTLRAALNADQPAYEPSVTTRRLIRGAKEFIDAHLSAPLRLNEVACAVGTSPAYLTDVFRRAEGVPLHRYVVQLRLTHALIELPHVTDLTSLALDLGFSSHSHFAAAFRRAFGCTPSQFRTSTRRAQQRRIA